MGKYESRIRRGLPRHPGGAPWPYPGQSSTSAMAEVAEPDSVLNNASGRGNIGQETESTLSLDTGQPGILRVSRRGLPRIKGGEAWPPPIDVQAAPLEPADTIELAPPAASTRTAHSGLPQTAEKTSQAVSMTEPVGEMGRSNDNPVDASLLSTASKQAGAGPIQEAPKAHPGENCTPAALLLQEQEPAAPVPPPTSTSRACNAETAPAATSVALKEAKPGSWSWKSKAGFLTLTAGVIVLGAMMVMLVRWLMSFEFLQSFLAAFPGEYPLPEDTPAGFPAWMQWQHFFNMFFIVLVIRTGLQVRTETRPTAFWTPKWSKGGKGKISLALWLHQSLDALWLINGIVFIILLVWTGHWARIVPTSWEVFPNALSALIQYISLDWPTDHGWVNYNGLQQLAYFTTVFIAAPLAFITGIRMSGLWPKKAGALSRVYPIELARAVHFPVMLYFVLFIIFHVALVFATGALRNLNHMYGGTDVVNWAGFWIFASSLVLVVAAWFAARPLILAPIAKLSGKVTAR